MELLWIAGVTPPANGEAAIGIWALFMEAGLVGKLVLGSLVFFSVGSWAIMIGKWLQFRRAAAHTARFLDIFRRSKRFSEVNTAAAKWAASPLVGIFQAGYVEVDAQVKVMAASGSGGNPHYRIRSLDGIERGLRRALGVEVGHLSRWTHFLATTAAATPFIGLFGTVWGIMIAFRDIGLAGAASLAAVAPGIAEALVNTAAGLGAAIPALIGYNFFANRIRDARRDMEDFILEFINLTERNFT